MVIGAAQIDISIGEKVRNLDKCQQWLKRAREEKVDLLVFPECSVNGYVFNSFEEAYRNADAIPGEVSQTLESFCKESRVTIAIGLLEKEGDKVYNTALLIGPQGIIGKYRKSHLLCLGVDRYTTPGQGLDVFSLPEVQVGILICYDMRFPEAARVEALKGAQVIVVPNNLPKGAEAYASFINRTRACENRVFLVSANRVGTEKGVEFIGKSQIVGIGGQILAEGSPNTEELILREITPSEANVKHIVNVPGEYEFDLLGDRRPKLYSEITKLKQEEGG